MFSLALLFYLYTLKIYKLKIYRFGLVNSNLLNQYERGIFVTVASAEPLAKDNCPSSPHSSFS